MAIVKMKKISLVLYDKYREESLKKLREIGVVHLEKLEGKGEEYEVLQARSEKLKNAAAVLSSEKRESYEEFTSLDDALEKAELIFVETDRLKSLSDRTTAISKETERIEPFGDFDPAMVAGLTEKGLAPTLFAVNKSDEGAFEGSNVFKVSEDKTRGYYVVIGELPEAIADFDVFAVPEKGLSALADEKKKIAADIESAEANLLDMNRYSVLLKKAAEISDSELEFEMVRSGINQDERLSFLSGFCPVPVIDELTAASSENGWGLIIDDPNEDDEVPTQLKLSKFSQLLTPVTDFLGILPGYREFDISFFFLCFFSVFTAMLIGDAGYGVLFLGVGIAAMIGFKVNKKPIPSGIFLLLLLSVSIIIYGAISGTWFASKSIMELSFFQNLKLDAFKVSDNEQISLVMGISFFLGIVQLLIGVVQNFRKNFPKLSSFAQIGWFAVLVAIYYLVLTLVVNRQGLETYPTEMLYVLLGGVVFIFLFGAQEEGKSFIKGIVSSLTNFLQLFLDVVGTFSDIMSYVRLFAVGLASVKIAETFNQLGAEMSDGPIIIFGILIVILGHTINIVLGLMAVLVHAVRLNILEYSGKVGVEWSGFKYEPFKINKEN